MILFRRSILVVLRHPRMSLLPDSSLQQHSGPGGHAGISVYAAVSGCAFDVREAEHLGVHQVPRAKVLIVTVAGGVAWKSVATWVAWVFITRLAQRERGREREGWRRKKHSKSNEVKQQLQIILTDALTFLPYQARRGFTHQASSHGHVSLTEATACFLEAHYTVK